MKLESIPQAIVLPAVKELKYPYLGACVCDSQNQWVAGLTRTTENAVAPFHPGPLGFLKSYPVEKERLIYRDELVVFGGVLIEHFGHFLIECLSRLWWFLQNPNDSRKIVFVYANPWNRGGGQNGFISQLLTLLGLEKERYEIIEAPTQFKEILIPEECARLWWDYTQEYNLIYDTLIANARKEAEVPLFHRLYLTHSQWGGGSQCVNEDIFEAFFQTLGFRILPPEKFSLAEQILYLNNAQEVVTTMGTLSHLALFCRHKSFFAVLTRKRDKVVAPQALIFQARNLNGHIVDANNNFLHTFHERGPAQLVMNENFQNFVREIWGGGAFLLSQEFSKKFRTDDYLHQWAKYYSTPNNFKKIQHLSAFDFVSRMAYELSGEILDKKKWGMPSLGDEV